MLVSAAYSKRRLNEEGFSTVRWDNGPSSQGFCAPIGLTSQGTNATQATCGAAGVLGPWYDRCRPDCCTDPRGSVRAVVAEDVG